MKTLHINVANKIATYQKRDGDIVCGNSDYQIQFVFDGEWNAYTKKTARFKWNGKHYDKDFSGDICPVPKITNTDKVEVGVFVEDLETTTSAEIGCIRSILCGGSAASTENDIDYANEAKEAAERAAEDARAEVTRLVGEIGVVQYAGGSPTAAMSQKATTKMLNMVMGKNLLPTENFVLHPIAPSFEGDIFTVSTEDGAPADVTVTINFYDQNKNYLNEYWTFTAGYGASRTFALTDLCSAGAHYVAASYSAISGKGYQLEYGATATEYEPFSPLPKALEENIVKALVKQTTGDDRAAVMSQKAITKMLNMVIGKNLLPRENWALHPIVPSFPGDKFTVSSANGEAPDVMLNINFYDKDGNYLGENWTFAAYHGAIRTFELTEACESGAYYVAASYSGASSRGYQLEYGDTATEYEHYSPLPKALEENIRKIFGNRLDGTSIHDFNPGIEMDEKLQQINRTKYDTSKQILSLLHCSDAHVDTENISRMLDFYNTHSHHINDILHTGDCVNYTEDPNPFETNGAGFVINVIGNHECWKEGPYNYDATAVETYQKFIAPFISTWGVVPAGENLCYYYKDYTEANIRLIVLDCMHFDEAQVSWLSRVLSDALSLGYSVVGVTHYPPASGLTPLDCTFTSRDNPASAYPAERMPDAAYVAVDNFIDIGGEFICWLSGHLHCDNVGVVNDHERQICVCVNSMAAVIDGDMQRTRGTKTQDCFNVVAFDRTSKLINIVRVGASVDHYLRSKKTLCIDYLEREVISNT